MEYTHGTLDMYNDKQIIVGTIVRWIDDGMQGVVSERYEAKGYYGQQMVYYRIAWLNCEPTLITRADGQKIEIIEIPQSP